MRKTGAMRSIGGEGGHPGEHIGPFLQLLADRDGIVTRSGERQDGIETNRRADIARRRAARYGDYDIVDAMGEIKRLGGVVAAEYEVGGDVDIQPRRIRVRRPTVDVLVVENDHNNHRYTT